MNSVWIFVSKILSVLVTCVSVNSSSDEDPKIFDLSHRGNKPLLYHQIGNRNVSLGIFTYKSVQTCFV